MLRHYTLILSKTELHSPTMSRRHNIKPGILKHGTPRNSGGTTENYPEYQRNTPEQRKHTKRRTIAVFLRKNLKLKN